jgi:hypothetical protein
MAIQKRYNGDSQGTVNVDRSRADAGPAQIISQGIGKHISVLKITGADFTAELGVGGAVEAILRTLQVKASTLAYQVTATQLAVIVEASGWGVTNPATGVVTTSADADLAAAIHALGNRAADATIPVDAYDFTVVTVDSTGGLHLA